VSEVVGSVSPDEFYFSVDIEADGPIPGAYSMLSLGAVKIGQPPANFYLEFRPISGSYVPAALEVSGLDRHKLALDGVAPQEGMQRFVDWIEEFGGRPVFVSFSSWDWGFVYYYLMRFLGRSPFGHSSLDIKSYYMGRYRTRWKETTGRYLLRGARELTHNALEDAQKQGELFERLLTGASLDNE
jgi:ribonuclease T